TIVAALLPPRKSEHRNGSSLGRCLNRSHQVVDIGVKQFVIERTDLCMGETPKRAQCCSRSIEGQGAIEHHSVLPGVVFGSIAVQIVEFKPNEIRRNYLEKFRG